jgi:hypothetical protein
MTVVLLGCSFWPNYRFLLMLSHKGAIFAWHLKVLRAPAFKHAF